MTGHNYLSHKPHRRIRRQLRQTGRRGQTDGGGQWRWMIAATFYWRVKSTATTAITEIAYNIIYIMFQLSTKTLNFFQLEVIGLIILRQNLNEVHLFIFQWPHNCLIQELLKFVYFQTPANKHRCHFLRYMNMRLILLLIVKQQNIGFCHSIHCSAVTFDIRNQNVIANKAYLLFNSNGNQLIFKLNFLIII